MFGMHLIDEDLGESGDAWLDDAASDEIAALERRLHAEAAMDAADESQTA